MAVSSPSPSPDAPRAPRWVRASRGLSIAAIVVIGLAVIVELIRDVAEGAPFGGYIAPVLVLGGALLGLRRPLLGLLLVALGPLCAALSGWDPIAMWSAACFAALLFAVRGTSAILVALVIGAANLSAAALHAGTIDVSEDPTSSIAAFGAVVAAAIGSAVLSNSRYARELEARMRDAELTRASAVERGIAEERVRIARDLHDSIGHHIAVVSLHLGAAEAHLPPESSRTEAELSAARSGIQGVLRETQQILRVLRVKGDEGSREPAPDHRRVVDLVTSFRAAGLRVEDTLEGLDRELPPGLSAAVYRICQELLTNAQRYGVGAVSLRTESSAGGGVRIEAVNLHGGPGRGDPGGGRGLIGMRERAESLGGRLEIRSEERLFWVVAELPGAEERPATDGEKQ